MRNSIVELKNKFDKIHNKGWIESKRNGYTGIGYTFEEEIGKNEDCLPLYDYKDIEIKVHNKKSTYPIHLFNAAPDGDEIYPIKRIVDTLGYPDKLLPKYKVFNTSASGKKFTNIGYYKRIKLKVDYEKQKIFLIALNNNNDSYGLKISWSFDLIRDRIKNKIKKIAVVDADIKKIDGKDYFKYNKINFYTIKDFKTFIKLIDEGVIIITFKIGRFRSGPREGEIHDRGTDFSISINNINKLYDLVPLDAPSKNIFLRKLSNWFGSRGKKKSN